MSLSGPAGGMDGKRKDDSIELDAVPEACASVVGSATRELSQQVSSQRLWSSRD